MIRASSLLEVSRAEVEAVGSGETCLDLVVGAMVNRGMSSCLLAGLPHDELFEDEEQKLKSLVEMTKVGVGYREQRRGCPLNAD